MLPSSWPVQVLHLSFLRLYNDSLFPLKTSENLDNENAVFLKACHLALYTSYNFINVANITERFSLCHVDNNGWVPLVPFQRIHPEI